MVTSLLFEVNDILLTGTSPLALANSIYYLRANARENYATFEIRPLSFIWESQPSPGSLSFLFVCLFFFFDTIDRRLSPSIKDPTKKACQLYHAPKI